MPYPPHKPYTDLTGFDWSRTLARRLIPVADMLRDLRTKFGMRPWEVHVVRVKWTGGARGVGAAYKVAEHTILPTPRVVDLNSLQEIVRQVGLDEVGVVLLDEISGRYTERQLLGWHEDGTPPDLDEQVWYEVAFPLPGNTAFEVRRFFPASAPHYSSGKFEWSLRLDRAHPDRSRTEVR
jgi:hypothetical protein